MNLKVKEAKSLKEIYYPLSITHLYIYIYEKKKPSPSFTNLIKAIQLLQRRLQSGKFCILNGGHREVNEKYSFNFFSFNGVMPNAIASSKCVSNTFILKYTAVWKVTHIFNFVPSQYAYLLLFLYWIQM